MATVLKMKTVEPIHIGDALTALSKVQVALQQNLPDAGDITIELTPDRDGKGGMFRARIELKALSDPAETVFILTRNLIDGYRFYCVSHTKSPGNRHFTVIAQIAVN